MKPNQVLSRQKKKQKPNQFSQTYVKIGTSWFSQKCENCPTIIQTMDNITLKKRKTQ
jgi:hypothetical protein